MLSALRLVVELALFGAMVGSAQEPAKGRHGSKAVQLVIAAGCACGRPVDCILSGKASRRVKGVPSLVGMVSGGGGG